MNKTVVFLAITGIAIVGVGGVVLLTAMDKDAGPVITMFGTTLTVAITAAATLAGINQVKEQTEKISKSVNGNTDKMLSLINRDALTPDEEKVVQKIADDNADLIAPYQPKHLA